MPDRLVQRAGVVAAPYKRATRDGLHARGPRVGRQGVEFVRLVIPCHRQMGRRGLKVLPNGIIAKM